MKVAGATRITTTAATGSTGTWLIDPHDYTIAASGGDITGTALSTNLNTTDVTILSSGGSNASGSGDVNVNDTVSWSSHQLTLTAARHVNINAVMTATGTAALALNPNTANGADAAVSGGTVKVALGSGGFTGRVDFSGSGALAIGGTTYTVINSLGAEGSTTGTDLQGISNNLAGNYVLGANIDASATSGWNSGDGFLPLGDFGTRFTGTFDGLGHTISNLTIHRTTADYIGLLGYVTGGGGIRNVGLVGANVSGGYYTAGLVGIQGASSISNSYVTGSVSGQLRVGGLAGFSSGTITNSYATASVTGTSYAGGLLGEGLFATITSSYATGNVAGYGNYAGGLVGSLTSGGTISFSYATGQVNVNGAHDNVGGLVGRNEATISNSYATGLASGQSNIGGLVGTNFGTISNSYSTALVGFSGANAGGLVGNNSGTVTNSYWNTSISGQTASAAGTGLNGLQIQQQANFSGWDFTSNWIVYDGHTAPLLRTFLTPLTVTAANAAPRTYDGTTFSGGNGVTYSVTTNSNLLGTVSYSGTAQSAKNAGTYTITPGGLYSTNQQLGYAITYVSGSLTINPRAVSLTGTRAYDGTTNVAAGAFTLGTLVGTETLALTGTGTVASKDAGTGKTVTLGTLALGNGTNGGLAGNYTFTGGTQTAAITAASLTLSTSNVSKTYDGGLSAAGTAVVSSGTLFSGDTLSGGTFAFADKNAGSNKTVTTTGVTVNDGNSGGNYTVSYANNTTSTINPYAVSLTGSRVYDGTTNVAAGAFTLGTLVGTETLALTGTGTVASKDVGTGKTVTLGSLALGNGTNGGLAGNYTFTGGTQTADITAATLTYTATAANRVYGLANPAFSGTVTGFVGGETQGTATTGTLSFSTAATTLSPAGSYALTGAGLTANFGNYVFAQAPGNATAFTIGSQVALTITANDAARLYGAANPAFTASYAGFINGDTSSSVTGLQFSTTATMSSNVGTYTITPFGATAPATYTLGYVPGTLTINPAALTYTANAASRPFGASNPVFGGTVTGFVNGDTQGTATTGTLSFSTTATSSSPIGSYALTGAGLTALNGNYVFAQAPGNATAFTIGSLVPLTITADNQAKLYGAALPTFTASYAGFVNGDTSSVVTGLQFSTTATISSNVGTYTITPFGASAPATYTLGYVPGTLTINPAALTLTANSASRLYGAANPAFTASYSGLVNGDTSAAVSGLQFGTTATTASGVGSYALTLSGATAANYTLAYVPGTLTVNPALLTLTANNTEREFGAANPAFTGTFSGFVNGDTSAVVTGLAFTTPATGTSAIGDYAIAPLGAAAANYTLQFVNGTLRVVAPTVMAGGAPVPVIIIGGQPVLTASLALIQEGDRLALVSLGSSDDGRTATDGTSVDERLALTLGDPRQHKFLEGPTAETTSARPPAHGQPVDSTAGSRIEISL